MSEQVQAAQAAFGNAASKMQGFLSGKSTQVIIIASLAVTLLLFVGYWVYKKLTTDYVSQQSYIISSTKEGRALNKMTVSTDASSIPNMTVNGQRATLTFWVYINNLNSSGSTSYVFRRGAKPSDVDCSPCAFFDAATPNKLHVRIPKDASIRPSSISSPSGMLTGTNILKKMVDGAIVPLDESDYVQGYSGDVYNNSDEIVTATTGNDTQKPVIKALSITSGITVPYIPMQRWVHVAVVVNEQVNGGTLTVYVDGEQVNQIVNAGTMFVLNGSGEIMLGADAQQGLGFEGLISYLTFWNYDLNIVDVYEDYRRGPIRSLLAKLGLGAYGVQSPVYKLTTA